MSISRAKGLNRCEELKSLVTKHWIWGVLCVTWLQLTHEDLFWWGVRGCNSTSCHKSHTDRPGIEHGSLALEAGKANRLSRGTAFFRGAQ